MHYIGGCWSEIDMLWEGY